MDNDSLINTTLDLSKCILDKSFKHWNEAETGDLDLINEIKRVITGAQNYYQKYDDNEKEIELISRVLRQYAENKYLEVWENQIEEHEKDQYEEIMEEGKQTFKHIFENEEIPY